ncbi:MAG: serine/threonine-protein kinase [Myxococcota bacterium]
MTDPSADQSPPVPATSDEPRRSLQRDVVFASVARQLFEGFDAAPVTLGPFVVMHRIGEGGMGTVYAAYDPRLERKVALKVVRERGVAPAAHRRLEREARAAASLAHPNVVPVFETGRAADGSVFIAMELVEGRTLRRWLTQSPRTWSQIVRMFIAAGQGLAAAHAAGLVHRDFKPDNVLVGTDERARVTDFGLASSLAEHPSTLSDDSRSDSYSWPEHRSIPMRGGTAGYIAPEQRRAHPVGPASDQFSFCVALREALELGALPLHADPSAPTPRPFRGPARLRRVLRRGLADSPRERWPSMDALLLELQRVVTPRRWPWAVAALSVGLGLVGAGLWYDAELGQRCAGAPEQLANTWNEAVARDVREALLRTGKSYGPRTWERVHAELDRYANAWVEHHLAACEATRVHQEQSEEVMDLRMACLARRRLDLRALLQVLARGHESTTSEAIDLVAQLPMLSRCDDVEALRSELPAPHDPVIAERAQALRERLTGAWWRRRSGEDEGLATEVGALVEQAEALGHPPVLAEALLLRGSLRDDARGDEDPKPDLERAYLLGATHEHQPVELHAAGLLAFVTGTDEHDHQRSRHWSQLALALADRPYTPANARARTWTHVGAALNRRGKSEEARALHERALALREATFGPQHPSIAATLHSLAVVMNSQGKPTEALEYGRRALAFWESTMGPEHPRVAKILMVMGHSSERAGHYDEALALHERALAIVTATWGPEHVTVATALNGMGNAWKQKGDLDAALPAYRRALAIEEAAQGPEHPYVAGLRSNVGALLMAQRRFTEAQIELEHALSTWETALGQEHPYVSGALLNLGNLFIRKGEDDKALPYLERGLALAEAHLGSQHPRVGMLLQSLATLYRHQERIEAARAHFERALELKEAVQGPSHPATIDALLSLGELERSQGRIADARVYFERALAHGRVEQDERAELEAWLAEHPARP